ncbi:hypothetical protein MINTM001_02120 [Mycobacterium paraintracellulare]|nr:hypothetical protein MINTM001_02120 [Mycobacterium paraintracellulare]
MATQTVRVDNLDIEYTDSGTGSTILFVHGVYVTGAVWNDVVAELGEGFRCRADLAAGRPQHPHRRRRPGR